MLFDCFAFTIAGVDFVVHEHVDFALSYLRQVFFAKVLAYRSKYFVGLQTVGWLVVEYCFLIFIVSNLRTNSKISLFDVKVHA